MCELVVMQPIDCHVHLYPPEANAAPADWAASQGEHHWALLCARKRKSGAPVQDFPTVDALLRAMDSASVSRVVLQGWYWEKHDTCVMQNRFFAQCIARHPDRLSAAAVFHPAAGSAIVREELRWAKENGFCGLGELSPHSQLFSIDDAVWREALQLAGELNLPVTLHVTEPVGRGYPGRVLTPLADFVRLAREHPTTRFILAHWGARLPVDSGLGHETRALRNVFYDTAASPLLYDPGVFREMVDAVGPDRVLFGSDYPLILFPTRERRAEIGSFLAQVRDAGLTASESDLILRRNAERLYGF